MRSLLEHPLLRRFADARASDDLRGKRLRGMLSGVVTSLGNRFLSVVIGFVSVPLTIGYLGPERYGAWMVIGAILAWVALSDLGIGNGLANALTRDASRDRPDLVRMHVSNFVFLTILLGVATGAIFLALWPFIEWGSVFGITSPSVMAEVDRALAIALCLFLVRLPLAVANRLYIAYQEGHLGNYWAAAGNVLSLAALVLVTRTEGGLPALVFALSGVTVLLEAINTFWLFGRHRPALRPTARFVDRRGFAEILKVGYQFFLIQIMALVTFQTDVLVIARFLGSASVPQYNLSYQLFNYALLPQMLLFPYLWSAYNEAITRGDIDWVRKGMRWSLLGGIAWSSVAALGLILIAKPFIAWWAGEDVVPTTALVCLMGVWIVINSAMTSIACLLAAASHLRYQLIYSAFATISNLVLSIFLVTRVGPEGVIAATVVSYLVFVCGPSTVDARFLLRRLERERASGAVQPAQF